MRFKQSFIPSIVNCARFNALFTNLMFLYDQLLRIQEQPLIPLAKLLISTISRNALAIQSANLSKSSQLYHSNKKLEVVKRLDFFFLHRPWEIPTSVLTLPICFKCSCKSITVNCFSKSISIIWQRTVSTAAFKMASSRFTGLPDRRTKERSKLSDLNVTNHLWHLSIPIYCCTSENRIAYNAECATLLVFFFRHFEHSH